MNLYFHLTRDGNWIVDEFPNVSYSWHIVCKTSVVRYSFSRKNNQTVNACFNESVSRDEALKVVFQYLQGVGCRKISLK